MKNIKSNLVSSFFFSKAMGFGNDGVRTRALFHEDQILSLHFVRQNSQHSTRQTKLAAVCHHTDRTISPSLHCKEAYRFEDHQLVPYSLAGQSLGIQLVLLLTFSTGLCCLCLKDNSFPVQVGLHVGLPQHGAKLKRNRPLCHTTPSPTKNNTINPT